MSEQQRGPDAKKVYSFRLDARDMRHWKIAAEAHGLTVTEWLIRTVNTGIYDFALALLEQFNVPARRSKLLSMQARLLATSTGKEDSGDGEQPDDHTEERSRGNGDVPVDRPRADEPRGHSRRDARDDQTPTGPESIPDTGESESDRPVESGDVGQEVVPPDGYVAGAVVGDMISIKGTYAPEPAPEQAKQVLARRGYCEHGTQRGHHCWRCGGKAKITGDPEEASKKDKARFAKKKKGKR